MKHWNARLMIHGYALCCSIHQFGFIHHMHICYARSLVQANLAFHRRKDENYFSTTYTSMLRCIIFREYTREIVEIHKVSNIVGVHECTCFSNIIEEGSTFGEKWWKICCHHTDKLTPIHILFPFFIVFYSFSIIPQNSTNIIVIEGVKIPLHICGFSPAWIASTAYFTVLALQGEWCSGLKKYFF